jgi:hypothetical protein
MCKKPVESIVFAPVAGAIVVGNQFGDIAMYKFRTFLFAALACTLAGLAGAETLNTAGPDNASRFESGDKPSRGMTEERVEAKFGQPQSRVGAVGNPPISRWEYENFVVYFEYDKVIHAVTKR